MRHNSKKIRKLFLRSHKIFFHNNDPSKCYKCELENGSELTNIESIGTIFSPDIFVKFSHFERSRRWRPFRIRANPSCFYHRRFIRVFRCSTNIVCNYITDNALSLVTWVQTPTPLWASVCDTETGTYYTTD